MLLFGESNIIEAFNVLHRVGGVSRQVEVLLDGQRVRWREGVRKVQVWGGRVKVWGREGEGVGMLG